MNRDIQAPVDSSDSQGSGNLDVWAFDFSFFLRKHKMVRVDTAGPVWSRAEIKQEETKVKVHRIAQRTMTVCLLNLRSVRG